MLNNIGMKIYFSLDVSIFVRISIVLHFLMKNVIFWIQDGFRTFDDFLREGLVEYLDVNEENNSLVPFLVHLT